jgi:hypothetical protein
LAISGKSAQPVRALPKEAECLSLHQFEQIIIGFGKGKGNVIYLQFMAQFLSSALGLSSLDQTTQQ